MLRALQPGSKLVHRSSVVHKLCPVVVGRSDADTVHNENIDIIQLKTKLNAREKACGK